ncbi:hypothetical protein PORY_001804 [Pneumocystis oryctolagi]|uniref:Uncharacterized protein n=1 Tax=Pneumocystis oryctolagi TaxID=42067 RepID=A0ACB7CB29_9ASCO|nr:hypothetical protein PORY_001804 [Pneumocystis oryctolagi]
MGENTLPKKTLDEIKLLLENIQKNIRNKNYNYEILNLTTDFLEEDFENYSIWNYRRNILKNSVVFNPQYDKTTVQNIILEELQFLNKLIKKHPKVYSVWSHRKWCFENAPFPIWENEKTIIDSILAKDFRNFHIWNYRRYIIFNIEKQNKTSYAKSEFDYTTDIIKKDFSNFSAFHYRTTLISRIIKESSCDYLEKKKFFDKELLLVKSIVYTSPENSSIWLYHNWLLNSISKLNDSLLSDNITVKLDYVNQEIKMVKDLMELEPNKICPMNAYINCNILLPKLFGNSLDISRRNELIKIATDLKKIDFLRKGRYSDLSI